MCSRLCHVPLPAPSSCRSSYFSCQSEKFLSLQAQPWELLPSFLFSALTGSAFGASSFFTGSAFGVSSFFTGSALGASFLPSRAWVSAAFFSRLFSSFWLSSPPFFGAAFAVFFCLLLSLLLGLEASSRAWALPCARVSGRSWKRNTRQMS